MGNWKFVHADDTLMVRFPVYHMPCQFVILVHQNRSARGLIRGENYPSKRAITQPYKAELADTIEIVRAARLAEYKTPEGSLTLAASFQKNE